MRFNTRLSLPFLLAATLTACGGGGGDGSSTPAASNASIAVTYSTSKAAVSFFQNQKQYSTTQAPDPTVSVMATLSSLPSGAVYPVIGEDKAIFVTGSTVIARNSSTSFTATLVPDVTLAPGVYTGTLTLLLCKDQACATQYPITGASLPYEVTVTPQLSTTVKINGVVQPQVLVSTTRASYTIRSGQTIEMDSNIPITWNYTSGPGSVVVTPISTTPTVFQASVTMGSAANGFTFVGAPTGSVQSGIGFSVTVTP